MEPKPEAEARNRSKSFRKRSMSCLYTHFTYIRFSALRTCGYVTFHQHYQPFFYTNATVRAQQQSIRALCFTIVFTWTVGCLLRNATQKNMQLLSFCFVCGNTIQTIFSFQSKEYFLVSLEFLPPSSSHD